MAGLGTLGIGVNLDLSKFEGSIVNLKRSTKTIDLEMKASMSAFAGMEKSTKSLGVELTGLSKKQEAQKKVVSELTKQYEEATKAKGESSRESMNAADKLNREIAVLNKLGNQIGEVGDEMSSLDFDIELDGLTGSLNGLKGSLGVAEASLEATLSGFIGMEDSAESLGAELEGLNKQLDLQVDVVEESRKKYIALADAKGESSKEAQEAEVQMYKEITAMNKLEGQIGKTEGKLEDLEQANKEVVVEVEKTGSAFTRVFGGIVGTVRTADGAVKSAALGIEASLNKVSDGLVNTGGVMKSAGGSLTKMITMPAVGAATAVGGLTAAFGWKRLVGLDNAKAQLEGMGFSAKEVGEITGEVSAAITGGMMTMAEGTSVAAGAMAAGVERGADLEKYLQLVDAAAVGAGRSAGDMAMIFNRVQGSGKLMTGELNQIEDSMPGFSQAMADHMGVGMEEFRKMVTDGEVSSEDFLAVMDGFAGGMAEAHSKTFAGMVSNTKANVGIIGEKLLSGVFEQSKESIGEFLDLLRSDGLRTWAAETGVVLEEAFTKIVGAVKDVVSWFTGLDDGTRKMYLTFGGLAVALGPILTGLGIFVGFIGMAMKPLAGLFGILGGKGITGILGLLGKRMLFLLGPIGVVIGAAVMFKDALGGLGETGEGLIGTITAIGKSIGGIFRGEKTDGQMEFLESLGLSPETITTIYDTVEKVKNTVINGIDLIKGIFKGDKEGTADALSALGFTPEMRETFTTMISTIGENLKTVVGVLAENVMPIIGDVIGYIGELFSNLRTFWDENGVAIMETLTKIHTFISGVLVVALPIVATVIQSVFNNIKGFLDGAFQTIGGVIKLITGIFTGDFSQMWEGLKGIFFGAIKVIWNGVQLLFIGKLITGAKNLIVALVKNFKGLWTGLINIFKGIGAGVSSAFRWMVTGLWNLAKGIFTRLVGIFTNLRTSVTGVFGKMRDMVFGIFTRIRTGLVSRINGAKDGIIKGVTTARDRAVGIFTNMKTRAKGIFDDIVSFAKGLPKKIGDAIKNGASKAVDGVKSLGNRMARGLGKVVNGVIGGINNVTGKLGIDKKVTAWEVPKFSRGTGRNGHAGGLMTVGDKGPGNGKGVRELVMTPDGNTKLFNKEATINAPKGTQVLSNKLTEQLLNPPKYSMGIGDFIKDKATGAINLAKGVASKVSDSIGNVWDAIKNPGKLVSKLVDTLGLKLPDMSGFASDVAKGAFNKVKDGAKSFFSKAGEEATPKVKGNSLFPGFGMNYDFGKYPFAFNNGNHYGQDYSHVYQDVLAPLGGTVTRNFWDEGGGRSIEMRTGRFYQLFMHMSKSLVKRGQEIKAGQKIGVSGNTGNNSTGPHLHYQTHKNPANFNAAAFNPSRLLSSLKDVGYYTGGIINNEGLYHLAERGSELVVPTDDTSSMLKMAHYINQLLSGGNSGNKRTSQLPNPKGQVGNSGLEEQNALMREMINMMKESEARKEEELNYSRRRNEMLEEMLFKEFKVDLDGRKVSKQLKPHLDKENDRESNRRLRGVTV